jgi:RHS repeat-associated protein
VSYDLHQIEYTYDALSRLLEADYNSGATVYGYGYDPAGNLVSMDGVTRTYNAANQMTHDGTNALTYDANGNLTHDGTNAYTWDRANRMIQMGSTAYAYDGLDNRIAQTNSGYTTTYINDVQPGLTQVVAQINGASTDRFVHGPRGVQAQYDGSAWQYTLQDGLNSVRGLVDASATVQQRVNYSEYGEPDTSITGFAFTGEVRDANGLQYHRARYYAPEMGIFPSLDPFEGMVDRPMSLNGYSWAEGNPVVNVDPSGENPLAQFIPQGVTGLSAVAAWCVATPVNLTICLGAAAVFMLAWHLLSREMICSYKPDCSLCDKCPPILPFPITPPIQPPGPFPNTPKLWPPTMPFPTTPLLPPIPPLLPPFLPPGIPPFPGIPQIDLPHIVKSEVFDNQMEGDLQGELELARRLGVRPVHVGSNDFDKIINDPYEPTIKWAVTLAGELLVIPAKKVDAQGRTIEISHPVLVNGDSVLAAGQATIAGDKTVGYWGIEITNHSGHYRPSCESLYNIGVPKFSEAGITFGSINCTRDE